MILSIFPRIEQKKRRKKKGSRANSFINILDYYSTLVRSSDGGKLSKSLIISEKEIRLEERIFSKFPPRRKEEREREVVMARRKVQRGGDSFPSRGPKKIRKFGNSRPEEWLSSCENLFRVLPRTSRGHSSRG